MHELSLCKNIIEIVKARMVDTHCLSVKTITLEIGELAVVEIHALLFSFELAAKGTIAEGATLQVVSIPGVAQCIACKKNSKKNHYHDACEFCGSFDLTILQGEELRVKSMEIQ